ncbi:MAG: large conductance mechanosensitive channel protein MscL [Lachnospirales bacterium]
MKKLFKEFKEFAIQGNMIDMSVGIVIGAAFTALVKDGLVGCVVTPVINWIIAFITGGEDVNSIAGNIGPIPVGTLLGTIINFVITAFVLFAIIKVVNKFRGKKAEEEAPATTKECPYCKSEIHIEATKCPNCTSDL